MTVKSFSRENTEMIGFMAGKEARAGDIFCLCGELGAGKTVFAQGMARALGYEGRVTSPTFNLMNEYSGGSLTLYHFDMYRLENDADLESIGYEDYFYAHGVSLVEWAERVEGSIPDSAIWIRISSDLEKDADYREITVL